MRGKWHEVKLHASIHPFIRPSAHPIKIFTEQLVDTKQSARRCTRSQEQSSQSPSSFSTEGGRRLTVCVYMCAHACTCWGGVSKK